MTPAHEQELWQRYRGAGDLSARDRLIEQNLSLVHHAARRVQRRSAAHVQYDDLLSAGALGLLQAVERFDPSRGWRLSTFAMQRIQGAILDHLRQEAGIPRTRRVRSQRLALARARVEGRLGRPARAREVAEEAGLATDEYHAWRRDAVRPPEPLTPALAVRIGHEPVDGAADLGWLADMVARLPVRERQVITLSYYEELSGGEIARLMGISESRVSQLRNRALSRLRGAELLKEAV